MSEGTLQKVLRVSEMEVDPEVIPYDCAFNHCGNQTLHYQGWNGLPKVTKLEGGQKRNGTQLS